MNKSIKALAKAKASKDFGGEDSASYRRNNRALNKREYKTGGLATVASYQGDMTRGRYYTEKNAPVVKIPKNAKIDDTMEDLDGSKMKLYGDVHYYPPIVRGKGSFAKNLFENDLVQNESTYRYARRKGTMRGPSLGK